MCRGGEDSKSGRRLPWRGHPARLDRSERNPRARLDVLRPGVFPAEGGGGGGLCRAESAAAVAAPVRPCRGRNSPAAEVPTGPDGASPSNAPPAGAARPSWAGSRARRRFPAGCRRGGGGGKASSSSSPSLPRGIPLALSRPCLLEEPEGREPPRAGLRRPSEGRQRAVVSRGPSMSQSSVQCCGGQASPSSWLSPRKAPSSPGKIVVARSFVGRLAV